MTLKDLLKHKATGVLTMNQGTSLLDAICAMCDRKVGSLLIEDDSGTLVGIATERDILRFCGAKKGELAGHSVSDAMTDNLIVATPDMSIEEAMTLMTEHRFRHLPVMENSKAVGMISIGDLVKARLEDVSVEAQYLRDYINA